MPATSVSRPLLFTIGALALALPLHAALLYDPAAGQLPESYPGQAWSYGELANPPGSATAGKSVSGGTLNFDTTTGTLRAGWSTTPGTLDRTTGYTISFDLQMLSESHVSNDRAGFSVIALSSDKQGIEIGFWGNEVWAQNTGFTHGEGTAFNTTAACVSYDLTISGSSYTLKAGGSPLLTGSLRDYSATGFPYTTANFLFLGDDTFSAQANTALGVIEFTPVPEPAEWAAVAGALLLGFAVWQKRRQSLN